MGPRLGPAGPRRGDRVPGDPHHRGPAPLLRPARARPARLQDLPRHLRRRQVRLEDPARHEGARPLPGVHQGLHRVPQARLRRVHRPPEEGRRRHRRGAAHAAPPRGDRGQRAARAPHPEGGQQAVRPRLPLRRGLHRLLDPLRAQAHVLLPRDQVLLRARPYYGEEVSVLEMDGQFDKLEELIYVESHLSNTSSKFYGEITQQMLKPSTFPGSTNGTGLFQTLVGLKIREVYERITETEMAPVSAEA